MPYFNLKIVDRNQTLATPASDRSEALAIFGFELGVKLTLEEPAGTIAPYLLDEWAVGPHWVDCTIPVFAAPT